MKKVLPVRLSLDMGQKWTYVSIDRKTGRATFTRVRTEVTEEEVENYHGNDH